MKTSIKTLIATSLTAIILSTGVFATSASAASVNPLAISAVRGFKKVSVSGNVEVTLIQRSATGVAYTEDNVGTAKITQEGDMLRITTTNGTTAKVIVYVDNIYRIQATENSIVKTEGKLISQYLQIFLKGNAHAEINTTTEGLYTVIEDQADLKLSGSTDSHTLVMGKDQKLTMDKFAALKTSMSSVEIKAVEKEIASNN
ncbi:GIN domain-containing protein [Pedobacter sp. N23S346]|uniref:GIN domain-containing protein n=1 Tax=Pedobacter sp. N23S346 TaxID=3402750 RepID=UPI003AD4656C